MDVKFEIRTLLDEVLSLNGRASSFDDARPLLGAIPELDSMAVVSLITAMEDRYGIVVDDDEVDADTFATVGSLSRFLENKLGT